MTGILLKPTGMVMLMEYAQPLYKTLGTAVDGNIEIVRPAGLPDPYCMVVNEDGLNLCLLPNYVACLLYGTPRHGHPIVGNAVIMKEGIVDGEPDIVGLDPEDVRIVTEIVKKICK